MLAATLCFLGEREKEERAVGQSPATTALFLGLCYGARAGRGPTERVTVQERCDSHVGKAG